MKRHRRIKHQRRQPTYTGSEVKEIILKFFYERLNPKKGGFYEIIYNNTIPMLDAWFLKNKQT